MVDERTAVRTRNVIIGVTIVILTVIGVIIAFLLGRSATPDQQGQGEVRTETVVEQQSSSVVSTSGAIDRETRKTEQARVSAMTVEEYKEYNAYRPFDFTQRYFPRLLTDDSEYEIGEYGTDLYGRPTLMPNNPDGDVFGDMKQTDNLDCDVPDTVKVQQQYVHGRMLAVSEHDGPSDFSNPYQTGYRKSAVGAAIAANNIITMSVLGEDDYSHEYSRRFVRSSENDKRLEKGPNEYSPAMPTPVFGGFRIAHCGGNSVTVEIANPLANSGSYFVMRFPMRWKDGQWIAVISDTDFHNMDGGQIDSLDGWAKVELV